MLVYRYIKIKIDREGKWSTRHSGDLTGAFFLVERLCKHKTVLSVCLTVQLLNSGIYRDKTMEDKLF